MMGKNKKKGFTLVELIIVIVIIGVLASIIIPSVINTLKKGKEEYINALEDEMILVAKDYYNENYDELPRGQLDTNNNPILYKTLSVGDLESNNYAINKFVDPSGNTCENSFVSVTKINGKYNYDVCVICNDIVYSDIEGCSVTAPETPETPETPSEPIIPNPSCSIEVTSPTESTRLLTITAITPNSTLSDIDLVNEGTSAVSEVTISENIGTSTVSTSENYIATVTNSNGQTGTCNVTIGPISSYSDWSDWTETACDTSNTQLCQTKAGKKVRQCTWKSRYDCGGNGCCGGCSWTFRYYIDSTAACPMNYRDASGNPNTYNPMPDWCTYLYYECPAVTLYRTRVMTQN